ncbi:hypothetical protein [Pleionea sp. CnH1-48]|uniref:hypothetical protein n=1 Tax=Pleionea sp. CnH1-48 TaxID=2954494 RepID=UPI002096C852|nr:hypothetical protein [Pleionea sp. CnH1-48]MCO7224717.1 hypothetical protein [Pleionea sp. CnH1-48]
MVTLFDKKITSSKVVSVWILDKRRMEVPGYLINGRLRDLEGNIYKDADWRMREQAFDKVRDL